MLIKLSLTQYYFFISCIFFIYPFNFGRSCTPALNKTIILFCLLKLSQNSSTGFTWRQIQLSWHNSFKRAVGYFALVFGLLSPIQVRTAAVIRSLRLLLYLGVVFQSRCRSCQQHHKLRPGALAFDIPFGPNSPHGTNPSARHGLKQV